MCKIFIIAIRDIMPIDSKKQVSVKKLYLKLNERRRNNEVIVTLFKPIMSILNCTNCNYFL